MALVAPQAMKAKGPSDPRAVNGQAPGCARRQGTGCPKNLQADRAKARPPGFGSYPAHPLILDLATPDFTTRKGAQFSLGLNDPIVSNAMTSREQDARDAIARLQSERVEVQGEIERLNFSRHQMVDRLASINSDIA